MYKRQVVDGVVYKLRLLPSGIVRKNKISIIGNGVVVDPWALLEEIYEIKSKGVEVNSENLILSEANINIWPDKRGLSSCWFPEAAIKGSKGEGRYSYFGLDALFRAIGMMLLGVVLFRSKVLSGNLDIKIYKRMAFIGLAMGVPLGILSLLWLGLNGYSPDVAIIGFIPNKIGIIPMTIAYIGILSILNKKFSSKAGSYIRACGKMALTNYITQTLFCYIVLNILFINAELTRKEIFIFVLIIWAIQIIWSKYWLDKFKYGPLEWIWRCLTNFKLFSISNIILPIAQNLSFILKSTLIFGFIGLIIFLSFYITSFFVTNEEPDKIYITTAKIVIPGGVQLNGRQIYEDAIRELEELENTLKTEYELPPLDLIG